MAKKTSIKERDDLISGQPSDAKAPISEARPLTDSPTVNTGRFVDRAEYVDERKLHIQLNDAASQRFDQIITTLSYGALGFSILVVNVSSR